MTAKEREAKLELAMLCLMGAVGTLEKIRLGEITIDQALVQYAQAAINIEKELEKCRESK